MLEEEYQPRRQLPLHLRPPEPEEPAFAYELRAAEPSDVPSIREIYNHYVLNSSITLSDTPLSMAEARKKFDTARQRGYTFIVETSPGGQVLGFAYVYPWKEKAAYRFTVENSIYLGPAATGKGLGKALLKELIDRSKQAGIKEMLAVIADQGAEASIRLHEGFGFKEVGRLGRVGFKFGHWLGTVLLQKSLK